LSGNQNEQIETFKVLSNLTTIDFSWKQITQIEKKTFQGLNNLVSINLSSNKITQIEKETFQGLNNLVSINLSSNKITQIETKTFKGLNSLKKIELHRNNFIQRAFLKLFLEPSVEFVSWTNSNDLFTPKNEIQTVQDVILLLCF